MVSHDFPEGITPASFIKALVGLTNAYGHVPKENKNHQFRDSLMFYTLGWQGDFLDGILGIDCG